MLLCPEPCPVPYLIINLYFPSLNLLEGGKLERNEKDSIYDFQDRAGRGNN